MTSTTVVGEMPLPSMEDRHLSRGGETALSPQRRREPPDATTKEGIRGGTMGSPTPNLCRCTGYDPIVESIQAAAKEMS